MKEYKEKIGAEEMKEKPGKFVPCGYCGTLISAPADWDGNVPLCQECAAKRAMTRLGISNEEQKKIIGYMQR